MAAKLDRTPLARSDYPAMTTSETGPSGAGTEQPAAAATPDAAAHSLRILEALLFAAAVPLEARQLAAELPAGADISALLNQLQATYACLLYTSDAADE